MKDRKPQTQKTRLKSSVNAFPLHDIAEQLSFLTFCLRRGSSLGLMSCPGSRGFDFPQQPWVLLCNFARQVLLVTASGFCSSSSSSRWLWVAALPNHRHSAKTWEHCDIQHSPLRCEPCTVQGAQAPLLPHHRHPIPSPTKQESQQQFSATTAGASHQARSPLLSRELWLQEANTELHSLSLLRGTRWRAAWDAKELVLHLEGFTDGSQQAPKSPCQLPQALTLG